MERKCKKRDVSPNPNLSQQTAGMKALQHSLSPTWQWCVCVGVGGESHCACLESSGKPKLSSWMAAWSWACPQSFLSLSVLSVKQGPSFLRWPFNYRVVRKASWQDLTALLWRGRDWVAYNFQIFLQCSEVYGLWSSMVYSKRCAALREFVANRAERGRTQ